jgi:hypothetical protein
VRGEFYPEDFLVPWLAWTLRRPVKWVEDRAEHLVAANHSRQQAHRIAAAFDAEGLIIGLRDEVVHDNGAYCRTHGIIVPELTVAMLPGPYRIPAYRGRVQVVLTNKTPCGTYRAPGRFEGTTAREQLLDVAADQFGMDRVELRRRNLLGPGELPCERPMSTLGTEMVLDAGDYPALLAAAVAEAGRRGYPADVERGRQAGRRFGLGLAAFLEKSGLGPQETADVTVSGTGAVHVYSGGTSLGQGIETVLAQIAADALGVNPAVVSVVNGDTNLQPFGGGSWASRSTVVAGSAVHAAASAVRVRAMQIAARILEASPGDLVELDRTEGDQAALDRAEGDQAEAGRAGSDRSVDRAGSDRAGDGRAGGDQAERGGGFHVRGDPAAAVTLAEIARATAPTSQYLLPGEPAGLSARRRFDVAHMTYPYGVHVAVVEVDPGTGRVQVLRYLVAYEVGRAINPMLVEGQLRGGVAQGIGGALLEEFCYDEAGQPQSATFMDYRMPTAAEVPAMDVLVAQDAPARRPQRKPLVRALPLPRDAGHCLVRPDRYRAPAPTPNPWSRACITCVRYRSRPQSGNPGGILLRLNLAHGGPAHLRNVCLPDAGRFLSRSSPQWCSARGCSTEADRCNGYCLHRSTRSSCLPELALVDYRNECKFRRKRPVHWASWHRSRNRVRGGVRERSTVLDIARGSRWPAKYPGRTLSHPFLDEWRGREDQLAADAEAKRAYQEGVKRGDLTPIPVWASEAIDLINDLPPASELVGTLVAQAENALARAGKR